MCLQCNCDAISYGEVLPGWALMRARKDDYGDSPEWKTGEWGLVRINDPDYIWSGDLLKNPMLDWTDDQIDSCEDDAVIAAENKFVDCWLNLHDNLVGNAECGYELCLAAISVGWNKETTRLPEWLMDRMANWVETHSSIDNDGEKANA
jgi:hypothetical protein